MQRFKKIFVLLVAIILTFSVFGCENSSGDGSSVDSSSTSFSVEGNSSESSNKLNSTSSNSSSSNTPSQEDAYIRLNDNYVLFGFYPQTEVTDSTVKTALNDLYGTLPTAENFNGWVDYEYYIESTAQSYMWYKDITYSEEKYRAVYFTSYRPEFCYEKSTDTKSYQDDNGYTIGNVYYFKWEPIKWRILQEDNGLATLLCEMIIDSQEYYYNYNTRTINSSTIYANNYEYSNIRKFLNDNFYNTAFSSLQQSIINVIEVDNSERSTFPNFNESYTNAGINIYKCNNTQDKIWLMSEQEVTTEAYGFNFDPTDYGEESVRNKKTTGYANVQGAWSAMGYAYDGFIENGRWWLRSPSWQNENFSFYITADGESFSEYGVLDTSKGVVPALQITL